jgi:hypothetical protein
MKNNIVFVLDLLSANVKVFMGCTYQVCVREVYGPIFTFLRNGKSNCLIVWKIRLFVKLLVNNPFFLKNTVLKSLYAVESIWTL